MVIEDRKERVNCNLGERHWPKWNVQRAAEHPHKLNRAYRGDKECRQKID